ncbi:MAG: hypothetical protein HBSAPP03_21450 [Phycisphaerae bacterium]|nr:MAG: hypothetical protein HBSAPP03_21450 [Phycisphaerae bacterium]
MNSDRRVKLRAVMRMCRSRRGVAAVLAMMFIVMFGSLATAMAIASKGNITTAATHLHVSRAQSAAETGLAVARARLLEASGRFVISSSSVDGDFGWNLWTGNLGSLGTTQVLPPTTGRLDQATPAGLAEAIGQAHALDQDTVPTLGVTSVTIGNAQAGSGNDFKSTHWVYTPAVALEPRPSPLADPPLAYQVTYAPLANGTDIRAIVTGYDLGYSRSGRAISRTISQDFRLSKSVRHAIVSSNRVMIGTNVMISGDIGSRFTGVTFNNGHPLTMKSDFFGKDAVLDQKLAALFAALASYDVDGDNRLRTQHPTEGSGVPSGTVDYDGDGQPDDAFADVTGDGYVDEFDLFIRHYDTDGDGKVTLSAALTAGTPAQGRTPEFVLSNGQSVDEGLALLIDSNNPDRNRNGVYGFVDANGNGRWDDGELMNDVDTATGQHRDQVLGYRDGFIDRKDQYAKVAGGLRFTATQSAWQTGQGGNVSTYLKGPIVPPAGAPATTFAAGDSTLPQVDASIFSAQRTALQNAADGTSFDQQVASQLGVTVAQLATYAAPQPSDSTAPWFRRLDPIADATSLPANAATAYWEKMPYNSPSYSDVYFRPVYYNMVFKDVQIPKGNNGLFINCTFVGVTWVRTDTTNYHVLWGEYGKTTLTSGVPTLVNPRAIYGGTNYPTMLPATAIPPNQNILMAVTPMDKADVDSTQTNRPGYSSLPDPLIISGRRVTDTRAHSNNLRFHDCLFVGSIVSDTPGLYAHTRNKVQFTGATRFAQKHPTHPDSVSLNPEPGDMTEIKKTSMMLPNYSVDLGTFNSPPAQNIELKGAIIAGVLDARGNVSIDGALMLTFAPVQGQYPLIDATGAPIGNPANFNSTIGYFGPNDGDQESLDPATLPVVNGTRIVGWDTNGDGMADVAPDQPQPAGSTAVAFNGYGRIRLKFDPKMNLPDGIMLPMTMSPVPGTYQEGHP